ncbi:MAG TPA: helix-turn-helix domain-containing protein [Lacisediminihabitans sp.]|nr:helix-turn-helix domain-containing protein [Lacisediminihabitans sp.]HXD60568.1 helix-turn-helix domain-containing protein [Lacisediminihabitans sp.]
MARTSGVQIWRKLSISVKRGRTLTRLSELVDLSIVNLSLLKNDRAKAIRFSTLNAICAALDCEVGELLVRAPTD